jgi:hypothetical protein
MYVCVYVFLCVCERERERERESIIHMLKEEARGTLRFGDCDTTF